MRRSRTPTPPRTTIVAAATRIDLSKIGRRSSKKASNSDSWQDEAWVYFDAVPEVGFACNYTGNAMAKLKLYAAVYPLDADPDADPVPLALDDPQGIDPDLIIAAQQEVDRIRSLSGGQAEILRELNINLEVAGEGYLIGWAERPIPGTDDAAADPAQEQWEVRSKDELETRDGQMFVKSYPDQKKEDQRALIDGHDVIIRIWQRHPRWSGLAWSPMKSCLGELRLLSLLSGQVMAETMSRHNAGLLLIPSELEPDRQPINDPDAPDAPEPESFSESLARGLIAPIEDPTSPASVVPIIARGQRENLDAVRHLSLSRESTETDAKIKVRLERLARGINLPVEVVMGLMSTTFANAAQVDEDKFEEFLEPRAILLVQGLTFAALQPALAGDFVDRLDQVRRIVVWYDESGLVSQPDPTESADAGWDRGLISDGAWRKAKGFSEADSITPEEQAARLAMLKPAPKAPDAMPATPAAVEAPTAPALARPVIEATYVVRGSGRRTRPLGEHLTAIDRDLRTRLLVLADSTLNRAMERAGSVLLSKTRDQTLRASLTKVPAAQRFAHAGPALVAAAGLDPDDLLTETIAGMRPQFLSWGATAQTDALEAVSKAVSGLSLIERSALQARQAGDLTEAWGWLESTLTALGKAKLYNPSLDAPPLGEISATTVPPGMIRSAMAQAGGATGLHIDEGRGVWLPLSHADTRPAGGIATGEAIMDTALTNGVTRDGYRWVYGPAARTRPFDPHVELDGVEFENFDDDALANTDSFPEFAYYMPGDHNGCICDFEPVLLAPT